jgi:hypothetical protein
MAMEVRSRMSAPIGDDVDGGLHRGAPPEMDAFEQGPHVVS